MGKKILLADDSITIQKVIELTFSDEDFEVVTVGNGRLAIEKVQEVRPDVVLCDVIMPEKDGYEVCDFIKKSARARPHPRAAADRGLRALRPGARGARRMRRLPGQALRARDADRQGEGPARKGLASRGARRREPRGPTGGGASTRPRSRGSAATSSTSDTSTLRAGWGTVTVRSVDAGGVTHGGGSRGLVHSRRAFRGPRLARPRRAVAEASAAVPSAPMVEDPGMEEPVEELMPLSSEETDVAFRRGRRLVHGHVPRGRLPGPPHRARRHPRLAAPVEDGPPEVSVFEEVIEADAFETSDTLASLTGPGTMPSAPAPPIAQAPPSLPTPPPAPSPPLARPAASFELPPRPAASFEPPPRPVAASSLLRGPWPRSSRPRLRPLRHRRLPAEPAFQAFRPPAAPPVPPPPAPTPVPPPAPPALRGRARHGCCSFADVAASIERS